MTLVKTSTETENIKKGDRKNKKDQLEMKNAVTEMKNTLQGIHKRVDEAEDEISVWNTKEQKTPNQNSKKKKRIQKNEDS